MTVPSNPKLSDLVNEFGGPGNLRAYYRGGPYVPNISANSAISTSASSLKLSQFAGAKNSGALTASNGSATIYGDYGPAAQPPFNVSGTAYATFSGGVAPFTVTWSKVSGTGTVGGTGNPGNFTASAIGATATGVFQFTVKDSDGTSKSAQMTITFQAKR